MTPADNFPDNGGAMSKSLTGLPLNLRVQGGIARYPEPSDLADLIDRATTEAGPKVKALIEREDDPELDVWINEGGATVWLGSRVLARIPPKENG